MSAIANPVDHRRIAELAADPPAFTPAGPYIVAGGRLVPNKNFPLLLRAYAEAAPRERLVLLGEGPERGEIGIGSCRERVCQAVSITVVRSSVKTKSTVTM